MDYSHYKQLEFRRRFWVPVGAKITVQEPTSQQIVGFIKMKAWKLREDVRLYTNESMQQEVIRIHARKIVDIGNTYDVYDSTSGQPLFSLRRKGLKSMFVRDHWLIMDATGNVVGDVQETSKGLALVRRWLGIVPYVGPILDLLLAFAPQTYNLTAVHPASGPAFVGMITHRKNPFIVKMLLDTSRATVAVDPRVGLAVTAMLSIIDANKNS